MLKSLAIATAATTLSALTTLSFAATPLPESCISAVATCKRVLRKAQGFDASGAEAVCGDLSTAISDFNRVRAEAQRLRRHGVDPKIADQYESQASMMADMNCTAYRSVLKDIDSVPAPSKTAPEARPTPVPIAECRAPADYPNIPDDKMALWKRAVVRWHRKIKLLPQPTTCADLRRWVCAARKYADESKERTHDPVSCRMTLNETWTDAACTNSFELTAKGASDNDSGYPQPGWCSLMFPVMLLSAMEATGIIPPLP